MPSVLRALANCRYTAAASEWGAAVCFCSPSDLGNSEALIKSSFDCVVDFDNWDAIDLRIDASHSRLLQTRKMTAVFILFSVAIGYLECIFTRRK